MKITFRIISVVGAALLANACATSSEAPVALAMNSEASGLECDHLIDVSTDLKCEDKRFEERYSDMRHYRHIREIGHPAPAD